MESDQAAILPRLGLAWGRRGRAVEKGRLDNHILVAAREVDRHDPGPHVLGDIGRWRCSRYRLIDWVVDRHRDRLADDGGQVVLDPRADARVASERRRDTDVACGCHLGGCDAVADLVTERLGGVVRHPDVDRPQLPGPELSGNIEVS